MTDATELKAAVGKCSVEHALLAILHALLEIGRTAEEISEGWSTVARDLELDTGARTETMERCLKIADDHAARAQRDAMTYRNTRRDDEHADALLEVITAQKIGMDIRALPVGSKP